MPFKICDFLGNEIGFIEDETEYTWRDMFDGTGSFNITMPHTEKNRAASQIGRYIQNVETGTLKYIKSYVLSKDSIIVAGTDAIGIAQDRYTIPERKATSRKIADIIGGLLQEFPLKFVPGTYGSYLNVAIPCLPKNEAVQFVLSASDYGIEQGVSDRPYVALAKYGETPAQTFSTADGSVEDWQISKTINNLCKTGVAYGSFNDEAPRKEKFPPETQRDPYPEIAEDIGIVRSDTPETDYNKFVTRLINKSKDIYYARKTSGDSIEYTVNARNKPYMIGQYAKFEIPEIGFSETRRIDGREITVSPGIRDEKIIVGKLYRQK